MFTLAVRGDVVTWVHCCYVGTLLLRGYIIVTWVYYCCVGTLLLRGYIIVTWENVSVSLSPKTIHFRFLVVRHLYDDE